MFMDRRWVTSGGWVDASEAGGGFRRGPPDPRLVWRFWWFCAFFLWFSCALFSSGSVLIGGSVALAVGGSTSCVMWLNGADPVVEWCGIEVLLWWGGCFFFVVVQWVGVGVGGDRRVRGREK
jgi:hypothetical protein